MRGAVGPFHCFNINSPNAGCSALEDIDDFVGGLVDHDARGKSHPAAAGDRADTDIVGIADLGADIAIVDAQFLSRDIDHRCAAAADIRMSGYDQRCAILVDV